MKKRLTVLLGALSCGVFAFALAAGPRLQPNDDFTDVCDCGPQKACPQSGAACCSGCSQSSSDYNGKCRTNCTPE